MIRRPPRSTPSNSSAASDVYKRQFKNNTAFGGPVVVLRESSLSPEKPRRAEKPRLRPLPHSACASARRGARRRRTCGGKVTTPSTASDGEEAVFAWQGEVQVRAVHSVSSRQGEVQLRGLQPLRARQGEALLRGLQPLPAWQAETQLRGLQPLPAWQAETQLRSLQWV